MTEKKYGIFQPAQSKLGGWFGKITTEDQKVILFETFQPTKQMCFSTCIIWIEDYNKLHSEGWRPDAENPLQEIKDPNAT